MHTVMVLVLSSCDCINFNSCILDDQVRCWDGTDRFYNSSSVNDFSTALYCRFSPASVYCMSTNDLTTDRHMLYVIRQNIKQQQQLLYIGVYLTTVVKIHHSIVQVLKSLTRCNIREDTECFLLYLLFYWCCHWVVQSSQAVVLLWQFMWFFLACFSSDRKSFVIGLYRHHKSQCCSYNVHASFLLASPLTESHLSLGCTDITSHSAAITIYVLLSGLLLLSQKVICHWVVQTSQATVLQSLLLCCFS